MTAGRAPGLDAARAGRAPGDPAFRGRLLAALAPLASFWALMVLSVSLALWVALATAFVQGLPAFVETRRLRILDAGNLIVFGTLAVFAGFIPPVVSAGAVRLLVDIGMLGTVLFAFSRRQPFTLQYCLTREVSAESVHRRASALWAACFATMACADTASVLLHALPERIAAGLGVAALAGALTYTMRLGDLAGAAA